MRELGLYTAYLTIPRTESDTNWWRWYNAGRGRGITLRPDNVGTARATLSFLSDIRGLEDLDRGAVIAILRRTFADADWQAPRVLAALDDAPLYFDALGQARLAAWTSGRVALVGDAPLFVARQRHEHQPRHNRRLRSRRGTRGHRRPPHRVRPLRGRDAPVRRQGAEAPASRIAQPRTRA